MRNYIIAGLAVSTLVLGLGLRLEVAKHANTKASLEVSEASLASYRVAAEQLVLDQVKLTTQRDTAQQNFTKASRDLGKLKDRETTVLKKKGLVELKINKAYNKQQLMLACITGDVTACGNK